MMNNNYLTQDLLKSEETEEKEKQYYTVLVAYSEIALKGNNRSYFINQLRDNIKKACKLNQVELLKIQKISNQILCEFNSTKEKIISCLNSVFGIKYFSFIDKIPAKESSLIEYSKKIFQSMKTDGIKTINIQVKRIDKTFPKTSLEIIEVMHQIAKNYGLTLLFKDKENVIYIKVHKDEIWIYYKKYSGLNGLPANCLGKTLSLLSGGIDSPVASYLTIKRGAHVDFIHFHVFHSEELVLNSKILKTIKILNQYQFYSKLYLVPHNIFDLYIMGNVDYSYELVLFKHFILKIAEIIAKKFNYYALITGDSLGQVASQTLENLYSSSYSIDVPVLRPLISFDKEEITLLAKKIRTYDLSIQSYKDCCSLIAKKPKTKVKREKLIGIIHKLPWEQIIEETLKHIKVYYIHLLKEEQIKEISLSLV
ncbi:MAG: putative tRNA sulfurtransferase [Leptospiraceae bacterium]|nr:MAG: putative tRNA sulfurtransferase [Leptospiraceae bacterium]